MPVYVEGLPQTLKAFKAAGSDMPKLAQRELRGIGVLVQREAKAIAIQNQLQKSGALVAGIKISVSRGNVTVFSETTRRSRVGSKSYRKTAKKLRVASNVSGGGGIVDYPYPAVYEYGGRGKGKTGPRAFMLPALERKQDEITDRVYDLLGKIETNFGRGYPQ